MGSLFLELMRSFRMFGRLFRWIPLPIFRLLDIFSLMFLIRNTIRYWKRFLEKDDLVHMKITMPRNDSKMDNERRTEKDFHEQIGKAEQLFRSFYEMKDLNLYNIIVNNWIWGKPYLSFEMQLIEQKLQFVIVCDKYYKTMIEKQITGLYETAEIEIIPHEKRLFMGHLKDEGKTVNGYYLHLKQEDLFPIQTYKKIEDDPLNVVANSFANLNMDECAALQIVINPVGDRWREDAKDYAEKKFKGKKDGWFDNIPLLGPLLNIIFWPIKALFGGVSDNDLTTHAPGATHGDNYIRMLQTDEEIYKSVADKANQFGFETCIRLMVASDNYDRCNEILNGMFVAWNVFYARGMNQFENNRIIPIDSWNSPIMRHNFDLRLFQFFDGQSILTPEELASIYHFPDARYNRVSIISFQTYKVAPPPLDMPTEGIILGETTYRGERKLVRIREEDRLRHMYIVGQTGTGKSVLLQQMASQDIERGAGLCVIDPHGDTVDDVLATVPKERAEDIIYFDPADRDFPMGLNILDAETPEQQERAALDAVEIFLKLFGNEVFGPRLQHYFRNAALTLMEDKEDGGTLLDISRIFIDYEYQKYKASKVRNPVVKGFWENEIAKTGDRERQEMIPFFQAKFGPFITSKTMRNIVGQPKSAFDFRRVMDDGKVLLVSLSKGKIGDVNAQLLGLVMTSKINIAAMSRADIPKNERKNFFLYVDEFQNFATNTFADMFSEARKYGLGLTVAHQYMSQLSEARGGIAMGQKDTRIRDAVFGNVGTLMNFRISSEDGEYLEKAYAPTFSQQDIISVANYKVYIKLNINNTQSRPFSMQTLYHPEKLIAKRIPILKEYSRHKYGRMQQYVNAEIEQRLALVDPEVLRQMTGGEGE